MTSEEQVKKHKGQIRWCEDMIQLQYNKIKWYKVCVRRYRADIKAIIKQSCDD